MKVNKHIQNTNVETKTNAKTAAKEAAKELTGEKMTKRQINAAIKLNLAALENDTSSVDYTKDFTKTYIQKTLLANGYILSDAVAINETNGEISVKLYIYYTGVDNSQNTDEQNKALCTRENYVSGVLFATVVGGEITEKVYHTAEGWVYAANQIKNIVYRHYCETHSIFEWDKYKKPQSKSKMNIVRFGK